jgi:hypothetical protein
MDAGARNICGLQAYAPDLLLLRGSAQIAGVAVFNLGTASLNGTTILAPGLDLDGCTASTSTTWRTTFGDASGNASAACASAFSPALRGFCDGQFGEGIRGWRA